MDRHKDDLDALFTAALHDSVAPTPGLMARVLQDAAEVQRGFARPASRAPKARNWLAALSAVFGGGPAVAGMAAAALAGVWIGLAQPVALDTVGGALWSGLEDDGVELIPDLEEVLADAEG